MLLELLSYCFDWGHSWLVSLYLLWGIRVDELSVDTLGFRGQFGLRHGLVFLTGKPEGQVLLTELRAQEPAERLQAHWEHKGGKSTEFVRWL